MSLVAVVAIMGSVVLIGYGAKHLENLGKLSNITLTSYTKQYLNDTVILGTISEENKAVVLVHLCSYDTLNIDLFLAPYCDLKRYPNIPSSETQYVNSTRNTTITEVRFAWRTEHIYMPQGSFLTFSVKLTIDFVMLVVFNNYTYFLNYVFSSGKSNAYLVHKIEVEEDSNSYYTFTSNEETSYYFAIESSVGTNFSYSYKGTVYSYNYMDYGQPQCRNLTSLSCEISQCSFKYSGEEECILGHASNIDNSRNGATIRADTLHVTDKHSSRSKLGMGFIIAGPIPMILFLVLCIALVCVNFVRVRNSRVTLIRNITP